MFSSFEFTEHGKGKDKIQPKTSQEGPEGE
jgi:hypothetical protein